MQSAICRSCLVQTKLKCSRCHVPLCSNACSVNATHLRRHNRRCIGDDMSEDDSASECIIDRLEYVNIHVRTHNQPSGGSHYSVGVLLKSNAVNLGLQMAAFYQEWQGKEVITFEVDYEGDDDDDELTLDTFEAMYVKEGERRPAAYGDNVKQFFRYLAAVTLCAFLRRDGMPWNDDTIFTVQAFSLLTNIDDDKKKWQDEQAGLLDYYTAVFGLKFDPIQAGDDIEDGFATEMDSSVGEVLEACETYSSGIPCFDEN